MMGKAVLRLLPVLLLLSFVLVLSGSAIRAEGPSAGIMQGAPAGSGDDSQLEVGVEYVQWYPDSIPDIPTTNDSALGLYYGLDSRYWTRRAAYGNQWAWEEDFKRAALGGTEWLYVDQWDLAMFVGHGTEAGAWDPVFGRWSSAMVFGDGGRDHDDSYLVPGDAYKSWGDGDLEWMAMHSCQVLSDRNRSYWASAMNGMHLILGFSTLSYGPVGKSLGQWFATYINRDYRISDAWFVAADITQPRWWTVQARVLAEDWRQFEDRRSSVWPDYGPDGWYSSKDHWVTLGRNPASLSPVTVNYQLPVYEVMPVTLTTDRINHLATSFGMTQTTMTLDDDLDLYFVTDLSESKELTVDQNGMFYFVNQDRLWKAPSSDVTTFMGEEEARQVAETFLVNNGLMPSDARFQQVISDTMTGVAVVTSTVTSLGGEHIELSETVTETVPTVMQVVYSRVISHPAPSGEVAIPVEGPGATIKVYVSSEREVVGAMGGWRTVTQTTALDTTPIIDEAQVVELLANLGPTVSLAEPLVLADQISVTNASVGYYEMPMGETQSRLVPVYILDSSYQLSGAEVLTAGLYLPAAPSLMNPLAAITSYTQTTPIIAVGDILTLTAADAAQPLSVLGYGDSLDFALGQGPYTYTWRLGTTGKVIGQGLSTTYRAGIEDHLGVDKENDVPLTIVLEVADATGHTSTSARQFYFASITPVQRVRLPLVLRSR